MRPNPRRLGTHANASLRPRPLDNGVSGALADGAAAGEESVAWWGRVREVARLDRLAPDHHRLETAVDLCVVFA